MLITAVAFTGTARVRDHWSVCTLYIVGPLILQPVWRFRDVCNCIRSDGDSSDEVFFCFHNRFIHQLLHVPPEEIQTHEVRWPGWPGHRATSADPLIPKVALRWFLTSMLKWAGATSIHRPVYQMDVSHFSMHEPFHVHWWHKAVMIATESPCFQADLRVVSNVSTHSQSAKPTQQLTSAPLTKHSLTLQTSLKLWHWVLNARKCVRYARTFY